jgi:hypothetical protein
VERIDVDVIVSFLEEGRRSWLLIVLIVVRTFWMNIFRKVLLSIVLAVVTTSCSSTKTFPCELAVETVKAFCASPRQNEEELNVQARMVGGDVSAEVQGVAIYRSQVEQTAF